MMLFLVFFSLGPGTLKEFDTFSNIFYSIENHSTKIVAVLVVSPNKISYKSYPKGFLPSFPFSEYRSLFDSFDIPRAMTELCFHLHRCRP